MGTRIGGFVGGVASEKGAEKECDVGLGLRMQKTTKTNITTKKMMMMMDMSTTHHHNHHHSHNNNHNNTSNGCFLEEQQQQQHCGPLFCNSSNNNNNTSSTSSSSSSMSDIYDVGSFLFPNNNTTETFLSYNSSGVMVSNANVRHYNIPFTPSQRQELETQTMIYKYMMASIPVPPQLLIPITKTTPFTNRSLELGISSNSSDSEPWRCKRTDGKKWRCSRNVIPDQKYCERHSHKTRPRSRKHVEQNSHFSNNTNNTNNNNNSHNMPYSKPTSFIEQRDKPQSAFSATSHDQPRGLDWFMRGHEAANSNQDWNQIVHPKTEQQQQGSRRATDFGEINHQVLPQQQHQSFFLDQTRHYIDAWSMAEKDHMTELRSNNTKSVPFSSLSLSIHGGGDGTTSTNSGEESGENSQIGFGIEGDLLRSQWHMSNNNNNNNNTISWDNGSPPGGPLAEALCLGMASSSAKESSSRNS